MTERTVDPGAEPDSLRRRLAAREVAVAALVLVANASFAANAVRISEVYSGGAGGSATYLRDYVELFNSSGSPVNVGGWALEQVWLFFVAPIIGAVVGALAYGFVHSEK